MVATNGMKPQATGHSPKAKRGKSDMRRGMVTILGEPSMVSVSNAVDVRPVRTRRERMAFIKMPWRVYENDSHWVPPLIHDMKEVLDPKRGLFFQYGRAALFLAYRDGLPVGRISAHVNDRHDEVYNDGKGFFGFFECENRSETAHALFAAAEAYLRAQGKTRVEGPISFSIYDEIAVLIDGFEDDPYVLTMYNPPYYGRLIEGAGYEKASDWFAFRGRRGETDVDLPKRYGRLVDRILKRGRMTLRAMDPKRFDEEAVHVRKIFEDAWDKNWGHVMFTDAEWARVCKLIKLIVVPELSLFAIVDGQPVGFALSVYDVNIAVKKLNGRLFPFGFIKLLTSVKKARRFRMILMGVMEAYRGKGYEAAFYCTVAEKGGAMGFEEAELSMVVDNNEPMLNALRTLPGIEQSKTFRIFGKNLRT
jgi:GNAT superfamily N-acetyltransferase